MSIIRVKAPTIDVCATQPLLIGERFGCPYDSGEITTLDPHEHIMHWAQFISMTG
jgi:hypothetical protein